VLALVLSFVLAARISRPLSGLTAATKKVAGGEYRERVEAGGGKEVEELSEAFNALSANLERNEELRQNMVADIAHELRNPLATLRGQLELLQDGTIEYSREVADSLMEDAVLLSRIVEDLRQLSLADAGKIEFSFQAVDTAQILKDVFARFEHEATVCGVKLEPARGDEVPPVRADPARLAQVLGNLVGNSITHTPRDGKITAGARPSGAFVVFTVEDTGAGLSPEELPYIFDRLYRTDKSRARSTGGAGLGLSIAKSLVEAHGGRIWAESESGCGTAIHFTFPVYQA
jgi:signal transduction histidine kinase